MKRRNTKLKWINEKIGRQLMFAFYTVFIALSLTSIIVYFYTEEKIDATSKRLDDLNDRRGRATALWEEWQAIQSDINSYLVFGTEEKYSLVEKRKAKIDEQTAWFEKNAIYAEGKKYAKDTRELYDIYFSTVTPIVREYVAKKQAGEIKEGFLDPATLATLDSGKVLFERDGTTKGSDTRVDVSTKTSGIEILLTKYRDKVREEETKAKQELVDEVRTAQLIWLSNLVVLALVLLTLVRPFVGRVTRQINALSRDSQRLTTGDDVEPIPLPARKDELYTLTGSFNQMAAAIADNKVHMIAKNEELQAQQEELVAQQEELQAQQEELEEALEVTLRSEKHLQYRNELTEVLASRETLTAYPEIIEKLVAITNSEIGAILFLDADDDVRSTIEHGMSPEMVDRLIADEQSLFHRSRLLKKPVHSSKQVAHDHPLPYPYYMYEVAVPVLDPAGNIIACVYLIRYRDSFSNEQMADILSFSNQLSLSLLRMGVYEAMEHEKVKTGQLLNSIREAVVYIEHHSGELLVNEPLMKLFPEVARAEDEEETGLKTFQQAMTKLSSIIDQPEQFEQYVERVMERDLPGDSLLVSMRGHASYIQVYAERIVIDHAWVGTMLVLRDVTKETESDRMKEEFVSTVSHELRTPLSSIYGFTELMLNKEFDTERQRKYLQTIHSETGRLTTLVNDFLDVQRMESSEQRYHLSTFDLATLARELTEFYDASTDRHVLKVEADCAVHIHADEEKIKQLINNMLSNAIKYSPDGGTVTVRLSQDAEWSQVDIIDEGIGIPKDALPQLFDKFYRVDNSATRQIGGTGLGLSICKEIVKHHGGTIDVESTLGEGTCFSIRFPVSTETETMVVVDNGIL